MGQRRVGKTVLMQQIIEKFQESEVTYISKENKDFDFLYDDTSLNDFLKKEISNGKRYICIDEVQLIHNWEKTINSIFSQYPKIDIFLTGSNSKMLSSELSTLLSGRYIEFHIFPFSYEEYLEFHKQENNFDTFKGYIHQGGLALTYELGNNELVSEWIKNLKNTIFLKDIVSRYKIKDVSLLEDIFLFIVNNIGNITNLNSILKYLKSKQIHTNLNTLASYIGYLKDAFLIYEVNLYDLRGKQVFDRERKFYISDHIFRKYLFSGFDTGIGKILENIVFLEAKRKGYEVYVGRIRENEIDFVLEKGGRKKYIQVAYILSDENVIKREFGNLDMINDNWEKYVITMDEIDFGGRNGIEHIFMKDMHKVI
ncbi:ATP-binding protein [Candidatus Gracilibacteria bacterium]|nr:ATP-binding protein [Candidatus Gracilibacteria bacterium]